MSRELEEKMNSLIPMVVEQTSKGENLMGPTLNISEEIHQMKYRGEGETFKEAMARVADALKDNEQHYLKFKDILYNMRFLPAGRVQSAMGAPRRVTPYNCFVSNTIEDSMETLQNLL